MTRAAIALLIACHVDAVPQPVTCAQAADHVLALLEPKDGRARGVRDAFEHRCNIDRWSEVARTCIAEEPALASGRHCQEHLTGDQRARLDEAIAAADAPRPARAPAPTEHCDNPDLQQDCVDYCQALFRLVDCPSAPQGTRESLLAMWAAVEKQLVAAGPSIAASCRSAADGLQQVGHAYACW